MENQVNALFNCQEMFRHACAFSECADMAREKFRHETADISWYTTPSIVNSAFACEIFLKALLLYHDVIINKEHNLKSLFEMLPERVREYIISTVKYNTGRQWESVWGFDPVERISNAFVEWRYCYEYHHHMEMDISFLEAFRNALRNSCSQLFFGETWEEYKLN